MRIIGFNFKKISVEKLGDRQDKLNINTKIDIPEIKKITSDIVKTKDELIQLDFEYTVDYEPDFAKINLAGSFVVSMGSKEAKELLEHWKDEKGPEDLRLALFNIVLKKCTIKALELEEEMNLPLHMPFPPLKPIKEKQD